MNFQIEVPSELHLVLICWYECSDYEFNVFYILWAHYKTDLEFDTIVH